MNRLFLFFAITAVSFGCGVFEKTPQKHTNQFIYLWLKPVNVDSASIDETSKKEYLIEGYTASGEPILVFVKADILKQAMRLEWPQKTLELNTIFKGYAFTGDYLGQESILTKHRIKKTQEFDAGQKEMLTRYRDREKYDLLSVLPIKVYGHIQGQKILAVPGRETNDNGTIQFRGLKQ